MLSNICGQYIQYIVSITVATKAEFATMTRTVALRSLSLVPGSSWSTQGPSSKVRTKAIPGARLECALIWVNECYTPQRVEKKMGSLSIIAATLAEKLTPTPRTAHPRETNSTLLGSCQYPLKISTIPTWFVVSTCFSIFQPCLSILNNYEVFIPKAKAQVPALAQCSQETPAQASMPHHKDLAWVGKLACANKHLAFGLNKHEIEHLYNIICLSWFVDNLYNWTNTAHSFSFAQLLGIRAIPTFRKSRVSFFSAGCPLRYTSSHKTRLTDRGLGLPLPSGRIGAFFDRQFQVFFAKWKAMGRPSWKILKAPITSCFWQFPMSAMATSSLTLPFEKHQWTLPFWVCFGLL